MSYTIIAGMHRSGTSLVARVVNLLGVDLGREEGLMAPKPDNPAGFWENEAIAAFNDDLLAQLGGRWDEPPLLEEGWERSAELNPWRSRAEELLQAVFGDSPRPGWKDPRMSLLLPFWRTVVEITHVVHVLRPPGEVVASLAARDGMDEAKGTRLWLRYTGSLAAAAPTAFVVRYDEFLRDPQAGVVALARFLGVETPDAATMGAIADVARPGLRHHRLETAPSPLARHVYETFDSETGPVVAATVGRVLVLESQVDTLQASLRRVEGEREGFRADRDRALEQLRRVEGEREGFRADRDRVLEQLRRVEGEREGFRADRDRAVERIRELESEVEELSIRIAILDERLDLKDRMLFELERRLFAQVEGQGSESS